MDTDIQKIVDAIDSEEARRILALSSVEPLSAEDLEEELLVSLTTVYRHTGELTELEFLSERTEVTPSGDHYNTFETQVRSITFTIESGEFRVDVQFREDIVDQFSRLWRSLEGGSG